MLKLDSISGDHVEAQTTAGIRIIKGHVKPWDAFWGQRYASVLDPDGNAVDLFAAL